MPDEATAAQNSKGSDEGKDPKDAKDKKDKDFWDKADVVLKFIAGVFTAAAVAFIGLYGSYTLERNQALDTDTRLYAELMSQRENAETSLRKDMFNSIIGTFLTSKSAGLEEKVLNLELLAYNFHEALDLGPLFKSVHTKIRKSGVQDADALIDRLEDAADEVKGKQVMALEDSGGKLDDNVEFDKLEAVEGTTILYPKNGEPIELMTGSLHFRRPENAKNPLLKNTAFKITVLAVDQKERRIRVQLEVKTPRDTATRDSNSNTAKTNEEIETTYALFWISPFDFPMIDNTRLPHGQRCALVLKKMGEASAELTLVYFPGSHASLKEKPFFDDAMSDLLQIRRRLNQ
ncbi:MAG TPA: hypothetical protein VFX97_08570 [Pyrinomonadaceae bacterium]|nr:hypothetical protein [Pyrinomonadaceae bacterium]